MGEFVQKENHGSAFTNERAQKDTDPAYLGTLDVEGVPYRIVIWSNPYTTQEGNDIERLGILVETEEAFQEKKAAREAANGGGNQNAGNSRGGNSRTPARGASGGNKKPSGGGKPAAPAAKGRSAPAARPAAARRRNY